MSLRDSDVLGPDDAVRGGPVPVPSPGPFKKIPQQKSFSVKTFRTKCLAPPNRRQLKSFLIASLPLISITESQSAAIEELLGPLR